MNKPLIKLTIIISLLVNSAGQGYALRPMATQVSGGQADVIKASSAGNSNSGFDNSKRKSKKKIPKSRRQLLKSELRHAKKPKKEWEIPSLLKVRPSGALSALIFVGVVVGTFNLSIHFSKSPLVIFGATTVAAGAFLWWCEMLSDVIMFFPRLIKHRFNMRKVSKEMEFGKKTREQRRASRRADKLLREQTELQGAGEILKAILDENPPSKFDSLLSCDRALTAEISARLTKRQRRLPAIKLVIENSRKEAVRYFVQKKIEDERARLAQQIKEEEARRAREIEEERTRKERELREEDARRAREIEEEKARKARELREAVEDLSEKTAVLTTIEQTLIRFKKDADAKIAELKDRSKGRLSQVSWTTFSNPEEYIKALEEAIAPEVKEDAEIKELFDSLKSEGAKNINERNNRLLISCRRKLSMLNPDMLIEGERPITAEEFSRRLTEIKKEFAILPGIDKLIEPKKKQWEKFEAAEHRANVLDGTLVVELGTTRRREGLHNLRPAREFGTFINSLSPNQRQRWFRRFDLTLAQKYYEIAQEELKSISSGQYRGPIIETEQVKIINAALKWLRERIEVYESKELKDMRAKLSKALYHLVKESGEQPGEPAAVPSAVSFKKVPEAAEAVVEETLATALKRRREEAASSIEAAEQMFEEDKGLNACSTLLVMLSIEEPGASKARYSRLKEIIIEHIIETARSYDKAGKSLTEDDEALLKGLPKIVRYVYIIAKLPEGSAHAAGIIWKERVVEELAPMLAKGSIDPERLQALYDKLTKELGMPTPKDLNSGGKPLNPLKDLKKDLDGKSSSAGAVIAVDTLAGPATFKLRPDITNSINSSA